MMFQVIMHEGVNRQPRGVKPWFPGFICMIFSMEIRRRHIMFFPVHTNVALPRDNDSMALKTSRPH